jgi:Flp pilus assembly pilin Flp
VIGRINVVAGQFLVDRWGFVKDRLRREGGQTFVEYSLVLLLVAVVLVAGSFITPFRDALDRAFTAIGDMIDGAIPE